MVISNVYYIKVEALDSSNKKLAINEYNELKLVQRNLLCINNILEKKFKNHRS